MKVSALVAQLLLMPQDADVTVTDNPYMASAPKGMARDGQTADKSKHLLDGYTASELRGEQYESLFFESENMVVVAMVQNSKGDQFD